MNARQVYAPAAELGELVEHPRNPRRGQDEAVAESIDANGFYGAILVQQSTGYVLAGHTRRRALLAQGVEHAPVIYIDVDEATATRILLADNQTAALAEWDDEALLTLLQEMAEAGTAALAGTGFDAEELGALLADMSVPLAPPSPVDKDAHKADTLAAYESTDLRQIILVFQREAYDEVIDGLVELREAMELSTNAAVVAELVRDALKARVPA